MINNLERYCGRCNLRANLDKSKVMVFRNGGKMARSEKWTYKNEQIECVNRYKYLGVVLTPTLNFEAQVSDKLDKAKLALNVAWKGILNSSSVDFSAKCKLFKACARAILCYGAQVWGFRQYDSVEKLQRLFIKKIFALPINTPNYMLFIETQLTPLFEYCLRLHYNYILRVMKMKDERLPKFLAQQVIQKKCFWFKEWKKLSNQIGINYEYEVNWDDSFKRIITGLNKMHREIFLRDAQDGRFHTWYKTLNLELGDKNYNYEMWVMRWILKARGELIHLNYKPWVADGNYVCSMCNLKEIEDIYHFIARCPCLREWRRKWFGIGELSRDDFVSFMNGRDWVGLAS
ncbi:uncharacterized protein LOC120352373 isoform X2 [Nilaparvata lugens]|uniref:uncharacterized protein LOC120352373 isoform X1 n=1 Tax=Nilaparvata lugens TaxID=108931 RepID=UPI00193DE458|nr:uncharacterized protein LOC120352373 isoform X1 [Nilaparvata lugens]XP_039288518.1 uncharacterized protein LOC120352373 isoform X2 [Nilaparvata lugens]